MRFAGHCWRSKNELASDLLFWYPNHGKRSRGRLAKTYIDQLSSEIYIYIYIYIYVIKSVVDISINVMYM